MKFLKIGRDSREEDDPAIVSFLGELPHAEGVDDGGAKDQSRALLLAGLHLDCVTAVLLGQADLEDLPSVRDVHGQDAHDVTVRTNRHTQLICVSWRAAGQAPGSGRPQALHARMRWASIGHTLRDATSPTDDLVGPQDWPRTDAASQPAAAHAGRTPEPSTSSTDELCGRRLNSARRRRPIGPPSPVHGESPRAIRDADSNRPDGVPRRHDATSGRP